MRGEGLWLPHITVLRDVDKGLLLHGLLLPRTWDVGP